MHNNTEPESPSDEDATFERLRRMPWVEVRKLYVDILMTRAAAYPLSTIVEDCNRDLAHTGWTVADIEERSKKSFTLKVLNGD